MPKNSTQAAKRNSRNNETVTADLEYEVGSGNVFEDLGHPEPIEAQAKAELARRVSSIINHRHLTQVAAASLLGIDQPKVSRLLRGQVREFSMERLIKFLLLLDRDVEIVIKKSRPRRDKEHSGHGRLAVCVT